MANQIRQTKRDVVVIEWILDVKEQNVSDTFAFQDRKCHLELSRQGKCNNIYLKSSGLLQPPVKVTVRVISNCNTNPNTTSIKDERQNIWSYSGGYLNDVLNIEVTIEADGHLKENKCIQTASYSNTDLSAEGLNKDFSELLSTGLNTDVELKCGEETFKAHKIVLCVRSVVFKAMLENDMQERRTGVVEIKDMDARYFQDFVRYLYTDAMPELTLDEATALYEAGDKYGIKSLMLRCSEYLRDNVSRENAFKCYVLADTHSDQKLRDGIKNYILDQKIYLEEEYWSPFCQSYPEEANEVYRLSYKRISGEETNFSKLKKPKHQ